jgi:hypothetical protein
VKKTIVGSNLIVVNSTAAEAALSTAAEALQLDAVGLGEKHAVLSAAVARKAQLEQRNQTASVSLTSQLSSGIAHIEDIASTFCTQQAGSLNSLLSQVTVFTTVKDAQFTALEHSVQNLLSTTSGSVRELGELGGSQCAQAERGSTEAMTALRALAEEAALKAEARRAEHNEQLEAVAASLAECQSHLQAWRATLHVALSTGRTELQAFVEKHRANLAQARDTMREARTQQQAERAARVEQLFAEQEREASARACVLQSQIEALVREAEATRRKQQAAARSGARSRYKIVSNLMNFTQSLANALYFSLQYHKFSLELLSLCESHDAAVDGQVDTLVAGLGETTWRCLDAQQESWTRAHTAANHEPAHVSSCEASSALAAARRAGMEAARDQEKLLHQLKEKGIQSLSGLQELSRAFDRALGDTVNKLVLNLEEQGNQVALLPVRGLPLKVSVASFRFLPKTRLSVRV